MKNRHYYYSVGLLVSWLMVALLYGTANGIILFESATLANEGTTTTMGTYDLSHFQHLGSRFNLDHPAEITSIGGHFIGYQGTFFGALVALDDPDAFPSIGSMLESEAIAYSIFSYNEICPSKDFRMPLSIVLEPGDYAVIFGSGLFGANGGKGGIPHWGQEDYSQADPIYWFESSKGWSDTTSTGGRFVVEGMIIPEPATLTLLAFGCFALSKCK